MAAWPGGRGRFPRAGEGPGACRLPASPLLSLALSDLGAGAGFGGQTDQRTRLWPPALLLFAFGCPLGAQLGLTQPLPSVGAEAGMQVTLRR